MTLSKKAYDILDADIYDNGHAQYIAIIGDDVYMTRAQDDDSPTGWFWVFEYIGERKYYEGQLLGNSITFDELPPRAKQSLQYVLNDMNEDKNLEYEESLSEHGDMEGVLEDLMKKSKLVAQSDPLELKFQDMENNLDAVATIWDTLIGKCNEGEVLQMLHHYVDPFIDSVAEVVNEFRGGVTMLGPVQENVASATHTATAMLHLANIVDFLNE